jgi:transcriptional regulator with XRE-family HTH domain
VSDSELADYEGPLLVAAGTAGNRRFGALVKNLRERSGLSPQQLAEQAGVHVSFIRGIERGAQAPSVATAHPLLACVREQDRIQWMHRGPYDLLVRDAEIGRDVAFEFKAKVKGQNRRTVVDLPGIAASLSVVAEALERSKVDPAPMTAALSVLAQALERSKLDAAVPGLLAFAEEMARIVPPVAETAEPDAGVVKTAGDGEFAWETPADEAAFGRVVRLLSAADEEMLARVESLLRDEV